MKIGDIKIEILDDRVEIVSPGSLPFGLSEEEFLTGRISLPRNKIISDIFFRLKIIEKMATGIRRIKEYYSNYREKPSFIVNKNSVTIVLPKVVKGSNINPEECRFPVYMAPSCESYEVLRPHL